MKQSRLNKAFIYVHSLHSQLLTLESAVRTSVCTLELLHKQLKKQTSSLSFLLYRLIFFMEGEFRYEFNDEVSQNAAEVQDLLRELTANTKDVLPRFEQPVQLMNKYASKVEKFQSNLLSDLEFQFSLRDKIAVGGLIELAKDNLKILYHNEESGQIIVKENNRKATLINSKLLQTASQNNLEYYIASIYTNRDTYRPDQNAPEIIAATCIDASKSEFARSQDKCVSTFIVVLSSDYLLEIYCAETSTQSKLKVGGKCSLAIPSAWNTCRIAALDLCQDFSLNQMPIQSEGLKLLASWGPPPSQPEVSAPRPTIAKSLLLRSSGNLSTQPSTLTITLFYA